MQKLPLTCMWTVTIINHCSATVIFSNIKTRYYNFQLLQTKPTQPTMFFSKCLTQSNPIYMDLWTLKIVQRIKQWNEITYEWTRNEGLDDIRNIAISQVKTQKPDRQSGGKTRIKEGRRHEEGKSLVENETEEIRQKVNCDQRRKGPVSSVIEYCYCLTENEFEKRAMNSPYCYIL